MSDEIEYFTKEEARAIGSLKRAFKKLPKTVRLYCTDSGLGACRVGTSSDDEAVHILTDGINAGCVLTDMHDELDNGEDSCTVKVAR